MKLTTITMALAFAAGTLGLSGAASAQDQRAPADQTMRHDDQMRHNDMGHDRATNVRREVRHYERHDRHSWGHDRRDWGHDRRYWGHDRRHWGHGRHCRIIWRHHHRIRQCW